jgi:arginine repressor
MTELKGRKLEVAKLLKRKTGATVEQICEKTGMLAHSARAFISRMPEDLKIVKTKAGDKPTVYKIEEAA